MEAPIDAINFGGTPTSLSARPDESRARRAS